MQVIRVPITNFQFGEISPSLVGRTDTQVYGSSAQKITNFILRSEGGVIKRPGTKFVHDFSATVDDALEQQVRLIPFIFSDDERYIIALSNGKIEIFILDFALNGSASSGAVTYLSSTVLTTDISGVALSNRITTARLKAITYAQSGDVLFLCHNAFKPLQLVRTGLTTFEVSEFGFDQRGDEKKVYQPYYDFQPSGYTLTPSATSGTGITVTVKPTGTDEGNWAATTAYSIGDFVLHSDQIYKVIATRDNSSSTVPGSDTTHFQKIDYFDDGSTNGGGYGNSLHIGVVLRYRGQEILITGVTSGSKATGNVKDTLFTRLGVNAFRTTKGSDSVEVTMPLHNMKVGDSIAITETQDVGGITNTNLNQTTTVTSIPDDNTFTYAAGASATSSADGGGAPKLVTSAATADWDEQSFSSVPKRMYPAAICFHEGRLWFGGTIGQPDGLWGSQSGEFFNFNVGSALDNESIALSSSVGQLDQIKHLMSNRDLQIFTVTSEFIVPAFSNTPITPSNAMVRRQTPYGIADVKPYVFDGASVYVQRSGSVVREFVFSEEEQAYVASSISSISSHLIKTPIQMTTLQAAISRPESYVFVVNSDGSMAVFSSNRAEKRAGWTEFTTRGKKGDTVTSAEFHSACTVDEKVFVIGKYDKGAGTKKLVLLEVQDGLNLDHSIAYTNGSSGVFTVSSQFANGAKVDVVSGNDYLGQFAVSSGQVNVSSVYTGSVAEIGFGFPVELKTNPLDIQSGTGPTTGLLRGLGRVIVDVNETLSLSVNGKKLELRNVTDDLSQPYSSFTGKKEFRMLGYSRDPQLTLTQTAPLGVQINSIIAEVQI